MNFGQLKTRILSEAHRTDLTAEVAGFVAYCEGMIRRKLRAYPLTLTLTDSDRVAAGVYTLPATCDEVRSIHTTDANGDSYALEQVSLPAIRSQLSPAAPPIQFAVRGTTIEFRGVPGVGSTLELQALGHPAALAADGDVNDLLTNHEALYVFGSLFFLYQHTQDVELAQGALDVFTDTAETLNEQLGRKLGGASLAQQYNFGPIARGY